MRQRSQGPKQRRNGPPRFSAPREEPPEQHHPNRPLWLTKSPWQVEVVFFDFETTGGNPHNSGITEIAAIKYINGQEVGRFQTLVNPERPIPRTVQKITGIDNSMVRDAPKIHEVFDEFIAFIGDGVLVSHGAIGDVSYITHHFKLLRNEVFQNYYICTHLLVANFLPNIPSKKLGGVANYFDVPANDVHRAMSDAELTAGVFWKIFEVCERNGFRTIEDLLKIQADNETLRRLGSGVLPNAVEERAPTLPGVFYLFNPAREIVYIAAAQNLKKRLLRVTELGEEREFNRLIADVVDFRIERTAHFLEALLREREEMQKLNLPIDPRKFEGRSLCLVHVLIPDDMLEYAREFPDLPLRIPESIFDTLDDVIPDPGGFAPRKPMASGTPVPAEGSEEGTTAEPTEGKVPIRKTRKTILGASTAKFRMLRDGQAKAESPITIGSLNSGAGWFFGPFEFSRNPKQHFEELLRELPFHDNTHTIEARFNYLHLFIAALYGKLQNEIDGIAAERDSRKNFFRPMVRYRLSQLIARITTLMDQNFALEPQHLPANGLAIITNSTVKEFDIAVVVHGYVRKVISFPLEESDKLRSPRFFTRLFRDYYHEISHPLHPRAFSDDLCFDIELFSYWLQNRHGEGEWMDFADLASLYDPTLD